MNKAEITARSAATGTSTPRTVTWQTQTIDCCGQRLAVATPDAPPVYVDESYGEVRGRIAQCGTCGSLYAARFFIN